MIYISFPNGERPSDDWLKRAKDLTDLLRATPDLAARNKIIDDNASFWGQIKDWLEHFSHGKCWFTEARDSCSYWQVEHFRPKKAAKDPDRDGYWWLAFDFRNFRLCGSVVNVKKGTFFPLRPGTSPASCPEHDLDDETCVLIDPVKLSDVNLITFIEGGVAYPSETDGWGWQRATQSIHRYKLNDYPPLSRARERVWNDCKRLLSELEYNIAIQKSAEDKGIFSPSSRARIETLRTQLRGMTLPTAEFSAVARACLQRDGRTWVLRLIA